MSVDYSSPITTFDNGVFTVPLLTKIQNYINQGNPDITQKYVGSMGGTTIVNPDWDPIDITYGLGTTDVIRELQTVNMLLCVIIFFLFIVTFLVSYYVIQNRFKLDRR